MTVNITIDIKNVFPEYKRFKYMVNWCNKSKNKKTKIRIIKHCIKLVNEMSKHNKLKFKSL